MKKNSFVLNGIIIMILIQVVFLFNSCEKELLKETNISNSKDVTVENGYLSFSDQQCLDAYISRIDNELTNLSNSASYLKSSKQISLPEGYQSLALKIAKVEKNFKNGNPSDKESSEELFFTELNKTLIPEEVIHYVVDTARRVKVNGKFYQITEAGTFIYPDNKVEEFENLYSNFLECYDSYDIQIDSITYKYGNVKFIDTYSFVRKGNLSIDAIVGMVNGDDINNDQSNSSLKSGDPYIKSEYTNTYNLTTYRVGGSSSVGRAISKIGLNNWRSKKFDSDHRVNANLYDLDYGFFKCAGFKVKFQYKKKVTTTIKFWRWKKTVTLYSYWKKTSASKLAIGVDYFKGYTEFTDWGLTPDSYQDERKKHSKKWAKMAAKMVFKGLLEEPDALIKGWINDLYVFGGSVDFFNKTYTETDAYKDLYKQGFNWLKKEFTKRSSSFVYRHTAWDSKTPIMMLSPGVGNDSNKEYLLLNGVNTDSQKSKQKVRFGQISVGARLKFGESNNWKPRPSSFTPNAFKVEKAYVFGAAKYNGEWKGVRLYIK